MPNFNREKKNSFLKEILQDNYVAVFLALILVVAINQVVFSYWLQNRDKAQAASDTFLEAGVTNFGNQNILAGTNDVVLAEFFVPDAVGNNNVTCNYEFTGNPCITTVDTDGDVTAGVGTANDGVTYIYDLESNGSFANTLFSASDGLCTDSLTTPSCVYVDSDDDCNASTGTQIYVLNPLDPAPCGTVADNLVGAPASLGGGWLHYENPAGTTGAYDLGEDIWIFGVIEDNVLYSGTDWSGNYIHQWQGDTAGSWVGLGNPGGEGFIDLEPTNDPATGDNIFTGQAGSTYTYDEPVIIDLDGDSKYEDGPDYLLDADGDTTVGAGTNSQSIPDGTSLISVATSDHLCINTLGLGPSGSGNLILYVDGDGDCIPGSGGTDILIRDDTGTGLSSIIAGLGTFPYTFFPAGGGLFVLYYDNNPANGAWDAGSESLWLEIPASNYYSPNIGTIVEADGTGSTGAGSDDDVSSDGLSRGTAMSYLQASDNVCLSVSSGGLGVQDIYIDGDGDCIPGSGGSDVILFDISSDGLNAASNFDGTWASAAGVAAYWDHVGGANGHWDYGADAASTETLFVEIFGSNTYTSVADTVLFAPGSSFYAGDILNDLSSTIGPNLFYLIYSDTDNSGDLNGTDTILEDNGNIQTGPVSAPNGNGVIDREEERFNRINVENIGTFKDLNNVRLNADIWWLGGDGHCDASDINVDTLTADPSYNDIFRSSLLNSSIPIFFRACVIADIPVTAPSASTIRMQIPELYDANSNGLYDDGDKGYFVWSSNDSPTGGPATMPYTFTIVGFTSGSGGMSIPESAYEQQQPPETGEPTPTPVLNLPEGIAVGDVIKTDDSSTLYLVTSEGKRRPFPNVIVWNSYYTNFSKVKTVSQDIMSQIPLGSNVTLRAGTWLIKTPTDSKVYAVEPGGVVRWLETQEIAQTLYGQDWAQKVVDLPDVFFSDYVVGESISTPIHPNGALIQYSGENTVYYIENGQARLVTAGVFASNNFQDKFIIKNLNPETFNYPLGDNLTEMADFFLAISKNRIKNNTVLPSLKTLR